MRAQSNDNLLSTILGSRLIDLTSLAVVVPGHIPVPSLGLFAAYRWRISGFFFMREIEVGADV